MSHRDIIVIGCSLGGVEALPKLVAAFPSKLAASVFVVMHMPPVPRNLLVGLLKHSTLPVRIPTDGQRFEPGHVYAAIPDHHLMIQGDHIRLSRGPKESHARPSIDVLFRSAAVAAGRRVIGVLLTGQLDDGTAGLWAIKDNGGIAIVQSAEQAAYPSMPLSALRNVAVDFELRIEDIPDQLWKLSREELGESPSPAMTDPHLQKEVDIALGENALARGVRELGDPSFFTCPECHGSMISIKEGAVIRFRCHTGHAFSEQALACELPPQVERTLWTALAHLEEQLVLLKQIEQSNGRDPESARAIADRIQQTQAFMDRVRQLALDPVLRPSPAANT
jgi:two-component system chemotaxis response regulator CheB